MSSPALIGKRNYGASANHRADNAPAQTGPFGAPATWPANRDSRLASAAATALVCMLVLSISLSPRLRVGFLSGDRAIDLRVQDFLLVPATLFALILTSAKATPSMRRVWGPWFIAFCYAAILTTLVHLLVTPNVEVARRVAFLARELEPFLLAAVVCRLCQQGGVNSRKWVMRAMHLAVAANALWFGWQIIAGRMSTLAGTGVGDQIEAYGPKLVGEASSFGAGSFFAFVAALAIAEYRSSVTSRPFAMAMFTVAAVCTYLTQSRASIASVAVLAIMFVAQRDIVRSWRAIRFVLVAAIGAAAGASMYWQPNERLTEAAVAQSANGRVSDIWLELWRLAESPYVLFFGVGPGGPGSRILPITEAHNVILRAWLDFGVIGAALLLLTLATTFVRSYRRSRDPLLPARARFSAELACLCGVWIMVAGVMQDAFTPVISTQLFGLAIGIFAGQAADGESDRQARVIHSGVKVPDPPGSHV